MINITPCTIAMAPHIAAIAALVEKAIKEKLAAHATGSTPLLPCEQVFYGEVARDVQAFIGLKPGALAAKFKDMQSAHLDYLVFAAGSPAAIDRHIPIADKPKYLASWATHTKTKSAKSAQSSKPSKPCTCAFCRVSANAKQIFNWATFTKKETKIGMPSVSMASQYVKSIGLIVCPYCSRNYVAPMSSTSNDLYRPDLDHFYAKSLFPYFALSPYNLIPSCSACNCRIKLDEDFMDAGYLHPYEDEVPDQLFVLEGPPVAKTARLDPAQLKLRLHTAISPEAKKSADFFQLQLAYEIHLEEVCRFVETIRKYPDAQIEAYARALKEDATYLKLIMNRVDDKNDHSYKTRALGKLMRDMYKSAK